ncbi:xanthine dehydrogenase family protein subunit M [Acidobacteria bacterium AH-259-D05]|nr:xanthine dehydrogenase family protein subunit M [Acidobacteria bacterium AH-259-D05]
MKRFTNVNPKNLQEAVSVLKESRQGGEAASIAGGGSDLLGMIKEDLVAPDVVVNLKSLENLERIEAQSDGVRIGGLVTMEELSRHPLIRSQYTVLAEAAGSVATPQIRNVGTLAGNLCQRPWCWYFRQGFPCYKHGGDRCYSVVGENQLHAIFGGDPSFIVHPSDSATALLALEARFRIVGPDQERWVPASEFFVLPRDDVSRENVLKADEVLVEVELPPAEENGKSTYRKIMDREAWTHAVLSVAIALQIREGICRKARVVLGAVAPIPWQLPEVDQMLAGERLTPELAREAGKVAVSGAQPLAKNGYKIPLTEALVRRTLLSFTG